MINFAANLNKMIDAGLGGPLDPPRTEVAVGHRVVYTEVSGDVVNFESNVEAPVKNLRVTMEPIQEGTGDPSPDNIRPITGRDSVTVWRYGTNFFDGQMENGDISETTGQNSGASSSRRRCVNYIPLPPGTTSLYFYNPGRNSARLFFYRADKSYMYLNTIDTNRVYTLPAGAQAEARYIRFRYASAAVDSDATASINIPSTDHDYHAYDGQSVTVQLGQTVYGGTLDVAGGSALKTMDIRDLSALTWRYYEADNYFYATMGNRFPNGTNGKGLCSSYKFYGTANSSTLAAMPDMNFGFTSNSASKYIYIKDSRYTDAASFQAAVAGVSLVYDLQPSSYEEIATDPVPVTTLQGENNVWSDAGNISLKYPYYEETEGY